MGRPDGTAVGRLAEADDDGWGLGVVGAGAPGEDGGVLQGAQVEDGRVVLGGLPEAVGVAEAGAGPVGFFRCASVTVPMAASVPPVSWREAWGVWLRVAAQSFGGPAGQISVMHRILVEEKRWIGERRFLHALNYCMMLPGPEAMQLATYIGWLLRGTRGGVLAGGLFILPGFLAILVLSVLYATFQAVTAVDALFFGIKAAVIAIVAQALVRIGRRALKNAAMVALAATAFVAMFFLKVPFPLIILGAAVVAWAGSRRWPATFTVLRDEEPEVAEDAQATPEAAPLLADDVAASVRPSSRRTVGVAALWLALWLVPVAALWGALGRQHVFVQEALFFSTAAVVTFGGAYAVLAYIAQQAVEVYGWLAPGEMLDGLGMAEATPGPLIQVVQFVGFMGAWRDGGGMDPMTAAVLASVVVTWVTFLPSFLFIFTGAPYIEWLRGRQGLTAALSGITAAVVGVILNLAIWFALHVLFGALEERTVAGVVHLLVPVWGTLDVAAAVLVAAALAMVFVLRWGVFATLGAATAAGFAWRMLVGA